MSRKVNFWGTKGNKASVSGEERANILLLACCYQEVSTGWQAVSLMNMTLNRRLEAFRAVDVVQLIGTGMCFGAALVGIVTILRKRQ